jgi:hypothetical protein
MKAALLEQMPISGSSPMIFLTLDTVNLLGDDDSKYSSVKECIYKEAETGPLALS